MKQMTKEQAFQIARAYGVDPAIVCIMIDLGLWTPTEPKSVEDEAVEAMVAAHWAGTFAESMLRDLKAAGFTVTKAVTP
jgi:hypothetical protein